MSLFLPCSDVVLTASPSVVDPNKPSTESEFGCDVVFLVGSEPDVQRIPAASAVLAGNSPVFRAMFAHAQRVAPGGGGGGGGGGGSPSAARLAAATGGSAGAAESPHSPLVSKAPIVVSDVDGRAFDILLR